MTVVETDFCQVAKLVQVTDGLGREEVKYGLGGKGSMRQSWKNSALVFKRPVKGVLGLYREYLLRRAEVGEELKVLSCQLEGLHQLPVLRVSSKIKNWVEISNLEKNSL